MTDQEQLDLAALGLFASTHTGSEARVDQDLAALFDTSPLSTSQRLTAFPRHVRRQDIARFLTRYELFKLVVNVPGSIAECGVFMGAGLMSWMQFSSILEPYNHPRRVIGFDTFTGFPGVKAYDLGASATEQHRRHAFSTHDTIQNEIQELASAHDKNRPLGHIPKIELVAGNALKTIPEYISRNTHVLFSLLYLDFDLYDPTKAAIEHLYPRLVKGGVLAFDELNCPQFPGETRALLDVLGLSGGRLQRNPIDPYISWFVKE